jgi:hypothetical protein
MSSNSDEVVTHGSLSVVVPMDDMKDIVRQIWKSRSTEKRMGELYDKYHPIVHPICDT